MRHHDAFDVLDKNLRSRFIKLVMPIVVLTVAIVAAYFAYFIHKQAEKDIIEAFREQQEITTRSIATALEGDCSLIAADIGMIAADIARSLNDASARGRLADLWEKHEGDLCRLLVLDNEGHIIREFSDEPEPANPDFEIPSKISSSRTEGIELVDIRRFCLADSDGNDFIIGTAIITGDSNRIGNILACVDMREILNKYFIQPESKYRSDCWILDYHGYIIYHSPGAGERGKATGEFAAAPDSNWIKGKQTAAVSTAPLRVELGRGGSYRDPFDNEMELLSSAPMNILNDSFTVVIATPHEMIAGPIADSRRRAMIQILGIVFLFTAFAYMMRRAAGISARLAEQRSIRSLFENTQDGIVKADTEWKILDANQAFLRMIGHRLEDVQGASLLEMIPREGHAPAVNMIKSQVTTLGYSDVREIEFNRKDGSAFPATVRLTQLSDSNGKHDGFWCVVRDITESKNAHHLQHARLEFLGNLVGLMDCHEMTELTYKFIRSLMPCDAGNLIMILSGPDGVDERFEVVYNFDTDDAGALRVKSEREFSAIDTQSFSRRVIETGKRIVEHRPPDFYEKIKRDETDELIINGRPSLSLAFLPLNIHGRIVGALSVQSYTRQAFNDQRIEILEAITADLALALVAAGSTEALRDREEHLKILFENAPDAIYVHDLNGVFVDCNSAAERMIGQKRGEIIGNSFQDLDFLRGDQLTRALANTEKNACGYPTGPDELRLQRKVGDQIDVEIHAYPVNIKGKTFVMGIARDVTERKKIEAAMRESEQRYRGLVESQNELIIRVDPEGRFTFVNDAYCNKYGLKREEIIGGKSFKPLVHPDDLPAALEAMKKLEKPPYRVTIEQRTLAVEGERWVEWEDFAITDERGKIVEIQAVGRDIHARRQAEEALAQEAVWRRILMEESRDGIVVLDERGKVFEANHRYGEMLGYGVEEVRQLHVWDWDVNWTREQLLEMIRRVDATGDHFETRHRRKDGSFYDVEISANGAICGGRKLVFCVCRDISIRKEAEGTLRESENRFRGLYESVQDGIAFVSMDGKIRYCNQAYRDMLGYTEEEIGNLTYMDLTPTRWREWESSIVKEQIISRGYSDLYEKEYIRKDGTIFPVAVRSALIRDGKGEPLFMCGIVRDMTERVNAEWELKTQSSKIQQQYEQLRIQNDELQSQNLELLDIRQKLQDARNRFSDLYQFAPVGYLTLDLGGVILEANQTGLDLLGMNLEEIAGRLLAEFLNGDSQDIFENFLGRIAETDSKVTCELAFQTSREKTDVQLTGVPTIYKRGDASDIHVSVMDITERKRMEITLREINERLEALVASSPLAIIILDRQLNVQLWNRAAETIFGWRKDEVIGRPLTIVPPEGDREFSTIIQRTMSGQNYANLEVKRRKKDGALIDISLTTAALYDATGNVIGIMGILMDISDHKRANEMLRKLATAVEQSAEGILVSDTQGHIEYVNPAFEKITGYMREEVIGSDVSMFKGSDQGQSMHGEIMNSLKRGEVWTGRNINKRKDGSQYTGDVTISPIFDKSRNIVNFVAVERDVTQEVTLGEQLLHAQKMEAVGRLAGGVAHDFNNLLTAITGYSEFLLKNLEGSPLQADIEEIIKASNRAATLTRQLLAFSRKQMIQRKVLDLNSVVSGMEKMLRRLIGEDVELVISPGVIGAIKADPGQLEQIIMNLAVNARDAMPDGGRLLIDTSDCEFQPKAGQSKLSVNPGPYVVLSVSDTGVGMDEETKARIFEPFFTTKEQGRGTGLGLSTVYGIVEQNGGFVEVFSQPDAGTTFKIFIPRYRDDSGKSDVIPEARVSHAGTETILLAEDEEIVRNLVAKSLKSSGYNVLSANGPEDALDICREYSGVIQLVLTDMVMPIMNGEELVKNIKQLHPDICVIYMSGYTENALLKNYASDERCEFVQKPFKVDQLAMKVRELLDKSNRAAALQREPIAD